MACWMPPKFMRPGHLRSGARAWSIEAHADGAQSCAFRPGDAAFVAGIGPLVERVTKEEYAARAKKLPPSLFAHNINQRSAQNVHAQQADAKGVLGRMADVLSSLKAKYAREERRYKQENQDLTEEYKRITEQFKDLQNKFQHFEVADTNRYRDVWQMNEEGITELMRKVREM